MRRSAVASEISDILKPFYCSLCDKQFKNVAQYDEHTNSYAHHHKARSKDMLANLRIESQEEIDRRKEKEKRREEKELRKIAAANGIKMPKPRPSAMAVDSAPPRDSEMAEPVPPSSPPPEPTVPDTQVEQASRSGWQKFQMSNPKRIAR